MESIVRFRPNGFEVFGFLAVAATTVLFMGAAFDAASLYASVRPMSITEQAIGCFGWLLATFGPIASAIVFWRLSKTTRKGWMLHLVLLPIAFALVRFGASIMVAITGGLPDFDDALGGPVLQAFALLILTIVGYYSAVLVRVLRRPTEQPNVL